MFFLKYVSEGLQIYTRLQYDARLPKITNGIKLFFTLQCVISSKALISQ